MRAAQNVDKKLISSVTVFDVYEGTGIEPGKKSVAIAVTMQPRDKTMTDAEIDALGQKIVAEVAQAHRRRVAGLDRHQIRERKSIPLDRLADAHGNFAPSIGPADTKL